MVVRARDDFGVPLTCTNDNITLPSPVRQNAITPEDLQKAGRLARGYGFKKPVVTLNNAVRVLSFRSLRPRPGGVEARGQPTAVDDFFHQVVGCVEILVRGFESEAGVAACRA